MTLYSGWDSFTPGPNEWDRTKDHLCKVCKTPLVLIPDCHGPTSTVMAMGGSKRDYDHWMCEHADKKWHIQAREILQEMVATSSPSIRKICMSDVEQILKSREPIDG